MALTSSNPPLKEGVIRTMRDAAPAHYLFKIESFSLLSKILTETGLDKYESRVFEASGYKWKLSVYPKGDEKRNGDGFISMQLEITDTTDLPPGWDVKVHLLCFVYDQLRDKYLAVQDGEVRRFHALKREDGFSQVIPLTTFNDASNGYLINDCCVFGVEVFTIKAEGKGERLSVMNPPDNNKLMWRLNKFSELGDKPICSSILCAGRCVWRLSLNPEGQSTNLQESLPLFLVLYYNPTELKVGWKIYVNFKTCLMNQVSGDHLEKTTAIWFNNSRPNRCFSMSISMKDLKNSSNGYLLNDTLIVELTINSLIVAADLC